MKKFLAILLTLCMLIAIVACDRTNTEDPTLSKTESATELPTTAETATETTAETVTETTAETVTETTVETVAETVSETVAETDEATDTSAEETTAEESQTAPEETTEETTTETVEETTEATAEETTEKATETQTEAETEPETEAKPMYVTEYPYTDRDGIVHITFQDTYEFDKAAESVLDIEVTSYKTGTDVKDEAILTIKDGKVYASGCGLAEVTLEGGEKAYVMVHPSPINLLFLTGQSNGSGDPPSAGTYAENEYQDYFIRSPETMAYYSWTGQNLSIDNANKFVPTNLVWNTCNTISAGCDPRVLTQETVGGFKNYSVCAGLAYEWIKQTGERVWIVNASHGGQPIHCFKPSEDGTVVDNDYYQAITVFNLALETLYKEVDAGHFTLNHMAYYWFQGEGDSTNTYDYY